MLYNYLTVGWSESVKGYQKGDDSRAPFDSSRRSVNTLRQSSHIHDRLQDTLTRDLSSPPPHSQTRLVPLTVPEHEEEFQSSLRRSTRPVTDPDILSPVELWLNTTVEPV